MRTITDKEIKEHALLLHGWPFYNGTRGETDQSQLFEDGAYWMRDQMKPKEVRVCFDELIPKCDCGNPFNEGDKYCPNCGSKLIFEP